MRAKEVTTSKLYYLKLIHENVERKIMKANIANGSLFNVKSLG